MAVGPGAGASLSRSRHASKMKQDSLPKVKDVWPFMRDERGWRFCKRHMWDVVAPDDTRRMHYDQASPNVALAGEDRGSVRVEGTSD